MSGSFLGPHDVNGEFLAPGDVVELVNETMPQYPGLFLVWKIRGTHVTVVPLPADAYDFDGARLRRYTGAIARG